MLFCCPRGTRGTVQLMIATVVLEKVDVIADLKYISSVTGTVCMKNSRSDRDTSGGTPCHMIPSHTHTNNSRPLLHQTATEAGHHLLGVLTPSSDQCHRCCTSS